MMKYIAESKLTNYGSDEAYYDTQSLTNKTSQLFVSTS